MKSKNLASISLIFVAAAAMHEGQEARPDWAELPRIVSHGEMSVARPAHQATTLPDGRILVTGGCSESGCTGMIAATEIYDPVSRTFEAAAPMSQPRASHRAVLLVDGRVLVAGGWAGQRTTASAEIYDPRANRWTPVADMSEPRGNSTATLLQDGRVLFVGGTRDMIPLASAEIFDPASAIFSRVTPMEMARASHAAVAGGYDDDVRPSASAWLIRPDA